MAGPMMGEAIFSTNLGQFPRRDADDMPTRIILRSVPEDDLEAKIVELRAKYPEQCKAIDSPVIDIYKYFDHYDQQLHGAGFLHAVLSQICHRNLIRTQAILDYVQAWSQLNPAAFRCIHQYGLNAFTEDDVEEYGPEFLQEVLEELQRRKATYDEASRYCSFLTPTIFH
ncbi:MAG: hypothetical protein L6R39_003606 [Caloplaca ligustica]|nr:MAG: hypothetical protein L6R39_003606 [Caloplaca ligustica]